jgi:hypothetical protein
LNKTVFKFALPHFSVAIAILAGTLLISCAGHYSAGSNQPERFKLKRLFPTETFPSVTFDAHISASPLLYLSQGKPQILVSVSNGIIAALDSETGALDWQINAPVPEGQEAQLISTPVIIGDKLVILYQCLQKGVRTSHRLAVIDLAKKQPDKAFPVLVLMAEKPAANGTGTVKFNPPTAYSHSALKHALKPNSKLGFVYAAFGNAADEQPYHGWLFEINMDAWQAPKPGHGSAEVKPAISSVLLTTPEAECPVSKDLSNNQEMICGGGIWTPAGPQIYRSGDEYEIFVPTGNGQIDLTRHDYANTVMRLKPGLKFEAGCDNQLCANFNPVNPDVDCMASCKNLFIPRLLKGDAPLRPAGGECDNKTFWECLARMDYDLGGSAPVKVAMNNGHSVLVQPGKEGGVYLIDAEHLGTQYDRLQIVDICGTKFQPCDADWMGMIVTQPVLTSIDEVPVVVIPAFVHDKTHPAGLVALKIVLQEGRPKFKRFWQFPNPSSPEAVQTFRYHTSLPVISKPGKNGDAIVWVVDTGNPGMLYGVRIKDGALVAKQALKGVGRHDSAPLIHGNTIYVASMLSGTIKTMIEAYHIEALVD